MDNNARARGFKRTVGLAKIPAESPSVMKRSARLARGNNCIVQEDIVPAVLTVLPPPVACPQGLQDPQALELQALLDASLAPIHVALADILAACEPINTALALLNAKTDNSRTRIRNSRLQPHEQWIPLQREVTQTVANGPAPGALPPADLLPVRGQTTITMTTANLRELSAHYGVEFASWSAFENFLQF